MINTDIVIIGGGCVGLTAGLALAEKGASVVVIDRSSGLAELNEPQARVSAISVASQNILTNLGAWQELQSERLMPYDSMHVWEKESFGDIHFDINDLSAKEPVGQLGHIIENNNIRNALIKRAEQHPSIRLMFETGVSSLHNDDDQVLLTLDNGKPLIAKLCVAADGANSWVKQQLKTPNTFSDYDHHAIVANIKTTEAHQQCARQTFLSTGPLALLPMFDQQTCSIVWSTKPEHADALMAMTDSDFNKALTAACDSVLGPLEVTTQRVKFPLQMRYAQQWVNQRVVFVGDAAHTIHPLAGLGMNLGLMDAASLAECIGDEFAQQASFQSQGFKTRSGSDSVPSRKSLRQYERWRKAEAQTYIAAMAGLKNLFEGANPIKKLIRGVGLKMTDKLGFVKGKFVEQAVGLNGDLPKLAKKESL